MFSHICRVTIWRPTISATFRTNTFRVALATNALNGRFARTKMVRTNSEYSHDKLYVEAGRAVDRAAAVNRFDVNPLSHRHH